MAKTFGHQASLPRLPVPELKDTLEAYLESVRGILTQDEFQKTVALAQDFGKAGGVGEKLQGLLVEKAKRVQGLKGPSQLTEDNHPDGTPYPDNHWLERWWETYAYQSDRMSIAVNVNCFETHFKALPCEHAPLARGAWAIKGALDGYRLLRQEEIPPEGAGKGFFCNAQYHRIYGTTRIPGDECDQLKTFTESRHICVERRGFWYVIEDALDLTVRDLEECLAFIKKDAESKPRGPGIAVLTGEDRTVWSKARTHLSSISKENRRSLQVIESALFHFVLSEAAPRGGTEVQLLGQHGNGSQIWFDKSQTHILFENGALVSNLEHSSADAVVPARFYVYIDEFIQKNAPSGVGFPTSYEHPIQSNLSGIPVTTVDLAREQQRSALFHLPQALHFDVDSATSAAITKAKQTMESIMDDNLVACLEFQDFGAKTLSRELKGISTDSFVQMSLALAYYREEGKVPVTYETATTRSFLHGRTETIRPQSVFMRDFLNAFDNGTVSPQELADTIRKAGDYHKNYLKRCMQGRGVDRHLMGLRILSAENGIPLHGLFSDKGYVTSTRFTLSTSQMPWAVEDWPGFGAYDPVAYACCYRFTHVDTIVATVASRRFSGGDKDPKRFVQRIEAAFRDIFALLSSNPPKPQAKL